MINTPPPGTTTRDTNTCLVDMKFIALPILITFVFTTIVITLLVLVLVWLYMTCKEKRKDKYQLNSNQALRSPLTSQTLTGTKITVNPCCVCTCGNKTLIMLDAFAHSTTMTLFADIHVPFYL